MMPSKGMGAVDPKKLTPKQKGVRSKTTPSSSPTPTAVAFCRGGGTKGR